MRRRGFFFGSLALGVAGCGVPAALAQADLLPSWRDGASRNAILDFIARATVPGADFVPVPERIAVFDNDGTL